jgi:PKD repeat protein
MKIIYSFAILVLLCHLSAQSQNLVKGEYFFNSDPGIGNGIEIEFTSADTVELLNIEVDVTALTDGYHKIFFRFMDENGLWSYNQQRLFFIGNLVGAGIPEESGQLVKAEYFFNADPGIGNGISVNFDIGDTITLSNVTAELDSISNGYNKIFFRFMDENGLWSYNQQRLFYKGNLAGAGTTEESGQLVKAEYFFNADPGIGNGINVNFEIGDTITLSNVTAELDSISSGYNKVFFRFMDENGLWSYNQQRLFYKGNLAGAGEQNAPLTNLEYFIGNDDPGVGNGVQINLGLLDSVNRRFINPVFGLTLGPEKVFLRLQDSLGRWSMPRRQDFTVCTIDGPEAGFSNIRFGNEVALLDTSYNASKWRWDFGDGTIDSTVNPRHRFSNVGIYNVKQVVDNICGKDSVITQVRISGIQDIHPKKGGDIGTVTINVYGVGFADSTIVYLQDSTENGIVKIYPETSFISSNVIIATFDLFNQPLGLYGVIVEKLDDPFQQDYVLSKVFEIEKGIRPEVIGQIIGPEIFRTGRTGRFTVNLTNIGNVEAMNTKIYLKVPKSLDIDLLINEIYPSHPDLGADSSFAWDTIPKFFEVELEDSNDVEYKVYPYIIPYIEPNGKVDFDFIAKSISNSDYNIELIVVDSYFENSIINSIISKEYPELQELSVNQDKAVECFTSITKIIFKSFVESEIKKFGECAKTMYDMVMNMLSKVNKAIKKEKFENPKNTKEYIYALNESLIWFKTFYCLAEFSPQGRAVSFLRTTFKLIEKGISIGKGVFDKDANLVSSCKDVFKISSNIKKKTQSSSSFDPNEKLGPSNVTGINYVQSLPQIPYTVMFENVDSAGLAAQEVIVYDTLDKEHLDLSTFELNSFNFADRTFNIPPGLQNYSVDVDLRPEKNLIVRITGQLDTATGVAKWHYISFDPLTMALTEDPILGFLEPNVNPPEGDGRVSYSVKPKDSLANGTVVRNRAKIVFDANDPILTNEWIVTIDDEKPMSLVNQLDEEVYDSTFTISWSGNDPYGEIAGYNIYVKINDGDYIPWFVATEDTSAVFTGQYDSTYKFFSIAVDYAGNFEEAKTMYDAYTTLRELLPPTLIYPDSGSVLVDVMPVFEWQSSDYAIRYHLQVSVDEDFEDLLIDLDNLVGLSYQYTTQLEYETPYFCRIRSINGIYISDWSNIHPFTTIAEPDNVPSHWTFKDSTGSEAKVLIPLAIKPMVGGRQIAQGDAIGAFYSDNGNYVCAGYGIWQSNDMLLIVWGDDSETLPKDGFADNELYTFVVWDAQKQTETKATVEYASGPDNFSNNAESVLSKLFTFVTHEIPLSEGWNMISTYVEPENTMMEDVFSEIEGSTVIVKNNAGQIYYPEFEINDIGDWDVKQAYQVYMSQSETLSITGLKIVPEETPIALNAGWNMITYLRDNPMDIEIALASLVASDNLLIAKDNLGNVFYPAFDINMIGDMLSGQGYQIFILNDDVLVYPGN